MGGGKAALGSTERGLALSFAALVAVEGGILFLTTHTIISSGPHQIGLFSTLWELAGAVASFLPAVALYRGWFDTVGRGDAAPYMALVLGKDALFLLPMVAANLWLLAKGHWLWRAWFDPAKNWHFRYVNAPLVLALFCAGLGLSAFWPVLIGEPYFVFEAWPRRYRSAISISAYDLRYLYRADIAVLMAAHLFAVAGGCCFLAVRRGSFFRRDM